MKGRFLMAVACISLLNCHLYAQSTKTNSQTEETKPGAMKQIFIDKFIVPAQAVNEFTNRMNSNRDFIKKLPGFIKDEAYERTDEQGNLVCITIAIWENEEVMKKARETVQAEYKKQGFDMPAMLTRLYKPFHDNN
jgi:heme-degrading monooxygenase HmoA